MIKKMLAKGFLGMSLVFLMSGSAFATPSLLTEGYARIHAEATALAGQPGDIPQRVVFLHQIFQDSRGNHVFPEVALHGALWAYGFFAKTGPIGDAISYRYFYDKKERLHRQGMLRDFAEKFKATNRQVFVDTYTNYYFSKKYGEMSGAEEFVPQELLVLLNQMHAATRAGVALDRKQREVLFQKALFWEQERSVGPMVQSAVGQLDCPILKTLVLKPWVHFTYFPKGTYFFFGDFSNKKERIARAMRSYEFAEAAGWKEVTRSMVDYHVLPDEYFQNPSRYRLKLRNHLLPHRMIAEL